jgi:DNA-binding NarL/FixJ family response regulator
MKVLIVDDSKLLQSRLKEAFLRVDENMEIFQVYNCEQAIKVFPSAKPDKVVLDISLPDGSGINLLKLFKKVDPYVKVIMFTNYPTTEFQKSCMKLGADHFLDKSKISSLIEVIA